MIMDCVYQFSNRNCMIHDSLLSSFIGSLVLSEVAWVFVLFCVYILPLLVLSLISCIWNNRLAYFKDSFWQLHLHGSFQRLISVLTNPSSFAVWLWQIYFGNLKAWWQIARWFRVCFPGDYLNFWAVCYTS